MKRIRIGLSFAAAIALTALPRIAAASGDGTQYALLVGCSRYEKAEFKELPYTGNDVEQFRQALLATGFTRDHIWLMHDDCKNVHDRPTKKYILETLALVLDGMRPEDTLVVAISGHGVQFKGDPISYFVPLDGRVADKNSLLPLSGKDGMYERLKACKAKKKLLIVNACRNDPAVNVAFAGSKAELIDEDRDEVPEGMAAIYSCKAGQQSYYDPDRKLALFFDHVIRAWKGEYTKDGPVTLDVFFRQVTDKTKSDAINTFRRGQVPVVQREYRGEWVIAAVPEGPLAREMKFVRLPKGTAILGGGYGNPPSRQVPIDYEVEIAAYTVTQGQWEKVMGNNPSHFSRKGAGKDAVAKTSDADLRRFPVENVSWDDVQKFIAKLNALENGTGWTYRLPKEAEWEYACRGAARTKEECSFDFYFDKPTSDLSSKQANFGGNNPYGKAAQGPNLGRPTMVGQYRPNRLGLYDMHGNVWQWCENRLDPKRSARELRGASWANIGGNCSAANRHAAPPTMRYDGFGLRLARVPTGSEDGFVVREMQFVRLPKGTAWLGGGSGNPPNKQVPIDYDVEIAAYTVTQGQWEALMGNHPSHFSRKGSGKDAVAKISDADLDRLPVECVSWDDVQHFLAKLNELEKGNGWTYRLPREAEWEYACRGAAKTKEECSFDFYLARPTNDLSSNEANLQGDGPAGKAAKGKTLGRTTMVGQYPPNRLGLFDMHGNVWQWCEERWDTKSSKRVVKGGAWNEHARFCSAANRGFPTPTEREYAFGVRLARVPAGSEDDLLVREMKFVRLPRGTAWLGASYGNPPNKQVPINYDVEIAAYTVTQGQWESLMGNNPSHFSRNGAAKNAVAKVSDADLQRFPVENVSWDDVQRFLTKLNEHEKSRGWTYRLPKEAEWEYACRGAPKTKEESNFNFYFAKPTNDLSSHEANFNGEHPHGKAAKGPNLGRPSMVGQYAPNALGLYDMHGNIWQLCEDYAGGKASDHAPRGASWWNVGGNCAAANRWRNEPSHRDDKMGFRLVRVPHGK
jgi:formylglycine-generating enzyme required for sulfatase activity